MAQAFSLRGRQREVVEDMIRNFDAEGAGSSVVRPTNSQQSQWVVLIYDDVGRNTIAPLLKVKDLRELGVTLHLHITKERDSVPGAPAIYFCQPTPENIAMIARDISSELYQYYSINFTAQVPRQLLESLADQLAHLPSINHVKVFDRTLSYVALSSDMFSLMQSESFVTLNSPKTTDDAMNGFLNKMVLGLSHVLLSKQALPIIAYSGSGVTQEVANRCSVSVRDLMKEQLLNPGAAQSRPLLLLVDRTVDIASSLHHPFTYRGLLTDTLGMKLNKVTFTDAEDKEKTFEVDPETDVFFRQCGSLEFDEISKKTDDALESYQREAKALSMDGGGDENDTQHMSKVIANAPKLAEKKRSVDAHTCLAHEIFSRIKRGELDAFHGVEESFLRRDEPDTEKFVDLLKDGTKNDVDKRRLFLVAYMSASSDDAAQEIEKTGLPLLGPDPFPAFEYLKKLRAWSAASGSQNEQNNSGWAFAQSLAKNFAKQLKTADSFQLPLTRVVDALLADPSPSRQKLLEEVSCVDPRAGQPIDVAGVRFSSVIVFVIGGGCIAEYDNLKAFQAQNPRKNVFYGCTEMVTGNELLDQLCQLGSE